MLVQLFAPDTCLYGAVEILGIDLDDGIHFRQIDGHAAPDRNSVTLDRRASAKGDDRHAMRAAQLDQFSDFLCRMGKDHCIGHCRGEVRLATPVLKAHRFTPVEARPEKVPQCLHKLRGQLPVFGQLSGHDPRM